MSPLICQWLDRRVQFQKYRLRKHSRPSASITEYEQHEPAATAPDLADENVVSAPPTSYEISADTLRTPEQQDREVLLANYEDRLQQMATRLQWKNEDKLISKSTRKPSYETTKSLSRTLDETRSRLNDCQTFLGDKLYDIRLLEQQNRLLADENDAQAQIIRSQSLSIEWMTKEKEHQDQGLAVRNTTCQMWEFKWARTRVLQEKREAALLAEIEVLKGRL